MRRLGMSCALALVAVALIGWGASRCDAQGHHGHHHGGGWHGGGWHGGGWHGGGWNHGWTGGGWSGIGGGLSIGVFGSPFVSSFNQGFASTNIYGNGLISGSFPVVSPIYGGAFFGGPFFRAPFYMPPVIVPAETWYGPGAVQRFMGVDASLNGVVPQMVVPSIVSPSTTAPANPIVRAPVDPAPGVDKRIANAPTRARANQFVGFGDDYFRKQKWHEAYSRYKDAVTAAPDLADASFRQALALGAMGKCDLAAKAVRRTMQVDADWPASGFKLETLYAGNQLAKTTHREALAKLAIEQPTNPDPLLLLGVHFYFDGEPDRAREFFERAKALEPTDFAAEKAFLSEIAKEAPALAKKKDLEL